MAFDWQEFLTLARDLAKRSAVSRAYCAAFGRARRLLRAEGISVPRSSPHEFVWAHFGGSAGTARQRISALGDRLKRIRRNADYDESFPLLDQ